MITVVLKALDLYIKFASEIIKEGNVVGFPTETVYGLGANAFDENAVRKIFEAKGRPADNPLIVHICDMSMLNSDIVSSVPPLAYKLAEKFWPGPFTMILPKSDKIPSVTSGGLDTVGVRFPSNETAQNLIRLCGVPIAAPSANLSGSPSPTNARRVYQDMKGRIPVILDGGECEVGLESTVVCLEGDGVRILRPGAVTKEMLSEVCPVTVDGGVLSEVPESENVRSPGMKYRHYAPKAEVILVKGPLSAYRKYVEENADETTFCLLFDVDEKVDWIPYEVYGDSSGDQARTLFEALRKLDERGAKRIFARCPDRDGVGLAVYNRILRAAGFDVVEV